MLCMCCGSPAERKHSAKSVPKSTKNVSGSTRKPPRAPTKQTIHLFCIFWAFPGLNITMILTHCGSKIGEKCDRKHGQKTAPIQNYFFRRFFGFSGVARTIFVDLGPQHGSQECPGAIFRDLFPRSVFSTILATRLAKKNAKSK